LDFNFIFKKFLQNKKTLLLFHVTDNDSWKKNFLENEKEIINSACYESM